MGNVLRVGDTLPSFTAIDHAGFTVTDKNIIGVATVLYFYPQDDSPGAIQDARAFRDQMRKFDELATLIIGISPDSIEIHRKFVDENHLKFTLLSDEQKEMCKIFGVLEDDTVIRSTFLVDKQRIIRWINKPLNLAGHVDKVLKAVHQYCPSNVIKFDTFNADYQEFLKKEFKAKETPEQIRERIKKKYNLKE